MKKKPTAKKKYTPAEIMRDPDGYDEYSSLEATKKPEIVRELTPELADKIWKQINKRLYDQKVSKEHVLHHLKQLKAQIGKLRSKNRTTKVFYEVAVDHCLDAIDKKIAKVSK